MKCPYCNGETKHRVCEYCDSTIPMEHILKYVNMEQMQDFENVEGESIESLCRKFILRANDEDDHDFFSLTKDDQGELKNRCNSFSNKLLDTLNIREDEEIYLGFDTGLVFKGNGGVAFTESGIHFKTFLVQYIHITWEEFSKAGEIVKEDSSYFAGGVEIATVFCNYTLQLKFLELLKQLQFLCRLEYMKL